MDSQNEVVPETAEREIVSRRIIKASQEKVFATLCDPDMLARWWGPNGFTNTFKAFELQPGGVWEFVMHGPDGKDYPNKSVFVDIVKPERVVFDHVFPPIFRMTITCEKAEHANETLFGFRMLFESAEICENLRAICEPANEQNFDRLEGVLNEL